jgi:phospholipid transport system substrate-binding protein
MLLVRTKLSDPNGEDVTLDYRMREVGGRWKIIDIYLTGTVSELALRRSEYSSLIKREGFKALLAALDERIESLATAPADQAS